MASGDSLNRLSWKQSDSSLGNVRQVPIQVMVPEMIRRKVG